MIRGAAACRQELRELAAFLESKQPMQGFVDDVKRGSLEKTALGLDYRGRSFEPYSDAYAKKKKGMMATGRPNLKVTGTMLGAMKAEVITPRHGRVSITAQSAGNINTDMLAYIHSQGVGGAQVHVVFNGGITIQAKDLSQTDVRKVGRELVAEVAKELRLNTGFLRELRR